MTESYVVNLKVIIVGDFAVGKTSLCRRYATGMFAEDYKPTIGVDIFTRRVEIEGLGTVILSIWDTAGQEKFRRMYPKYYKGAKYGLVVYDITDRKTFESIREWVETIRKHAGDIPIMLVGNKADLEPYREVKKEEGEELAEELNLVGFIETSARTGASVDEAFERPIKVVLERIESESSLEKS